MEERNVTDACVPAAEESDASLVYEDAEADEELAVLAKAIANPVRVRIIRMLARERSYICGNIAKNIPLAQSTISQHLKVLKEAGLIKGTVDGPRVCYCLVPDKLRRFRILVSGI